MIIPTTIVSSLNNYNSIAPIVTKDLVENGGRTLMAYKNAGEKTKYYEATEKFIEANASSFLWYGAIPLIKKAFDLSVFKLAKLNPNVSLELLDSKNTAQNIKENLNQINSGKLPQKILVKKGLFSQKTKIIDAKDVLQNVQKNALKYKSLHVSRMFLSTAIPTLISAIVLPKAIIALTQANINKKAKKQNNNEQNKSVSFTGLGAALVGKAALAQKSLLGDMVAVDLAISGSRVYYANKREQDALDGKKAKAPYAAALEKLIREGGFLYLIYFGGKHIKNFIDKLTKNNFDPIVLEDKNFISELKTGKLSTNPLQGLSEKDALKFIDANMENESQPFIKYAKKIGLIDVVKDENGKIFRNPIKYLDVKELSQYFDKMTQSAKDFLEQGSKNLEQFVKNKAVTKRFGVYGNLMLSSFAVCYILPKLTYGFRKWYTGSSEEPGIAQVINKNNQQSPAEKCLA